MIKGKIIGESIVGNGICTLIENVLLVDGLNHDLRSIVQFDKDFRVIFDKNNCITENRSFVCWK